MGLGIDLVERGRIPDIITRLFMRRLLTKRLRQEQKTFATPNAMENMLALMASSPLAINTQDANTQHYEVPTEFYEQCLGKQKKYSCSFYTNDTATLSEAEQNMLSLCCERANLMDGQEILELGCGWGSLTLWMAKHYPNSNITAVSNSATQKTYIDSEAKRLGFNNLTIITCDMNDFSTDLTFDRVVSIEMFEHMRNHQLLFQRITDWLKPQGKLFFHIFCHKTTPYFFETDGNQDWMAEHFFTGGLMPSYDLPHKIKSELVPENRWAVDGTHYAKTCRDWLTLLDSNERTALTALETSADPTPEVVQFNRWRMFFMACEELFGFNGGKEWFVGHYLFTRP